MFVPFGNAVHEWQQIIIFISIASMSLGALGALNQKKIKRLMAYSSISHVGYALIGVAVANRIGVQSALIYLTIYLIMNLGAFACILSMKTQDQMLEKISDLAGKGKNHPLLALGFLIINLAIIFDLDGVRFIHIQLCRLILYPTIPIPHHIDYLIFGIPSFDLILNGKQL